MTSGVARPSLIRPSRWMLIVFSWIAGRRSGRANRAGLSEFASSWCLAHMRIIVIIVACVCGCFGLRVPVGLGLAEATDGSRRAELA
jgi:hypothetical protein